MSLLDGMFPSPLYNKTNFIMNVLLPVASMTPPAGRIASCALTIIFSNVGTLADLYIILPLATVTTIPVHNDHKLCWLSPAINIGAIAAVAYALFNFVANPYAKVAVFAIHQAVTTVLARAQSVSWAGVITLDNGFTKLLGVNEELIKELDVDLKRIDKISEALACTAFAISTVALAYIGCHPILNSAMSSAMASATKALSIRVQLALAPTRNAVSPSLI